MSDFATLLPDALTAVVIFGVCMLIDRMWPEDDNDDYN
jgi:hypothetical protein